MSWIDIPRVDASEQIDDPTQPMRDLAASMADVARTNRWFGGTGAVVGQVSRLLRDLPRDVPIRILDIGTGSADIPRALVAWGARHGRSITVVAADNLWNMLQLAQAQIAGPAEWSISLVQANALALPFRAGSFDIAICALAFHHLGLDGSVQVLAAMDRLTTLGLIVTDLRRDRLALAGVTLALALLRAHPITRHDGPASVRRAFTLTEYRKIIGGSGVQGIHVNTHWYYRVVMVKNKKLSATVK